jgi:hypothetical protein
MHPETAILVVQAPGRGVSADCPRRGERPASLERARGPLFSPRRRAGRGRLEAAGDRVQDVAAVVDIRGFTSFAAELPTTVMSAARVRAASRTTFGHEGTSTSISATA